MRRCWAGEVLHHHLVCVHHWDINEELHKQSKDDLRLAASGTGSWHWAIWLTVMWKGFFLVNPFSVTTRGKHKTRLMHTVAGSVVILHIGWQHIANKKLKKHKRLTQWQGLADFLSWVCEKIELYLAKWSLPTWHQTSFLYHLILGWCCISITNGAKFSAESD